MCCEECCTHVDRQDSSLDIKREDMKAYLEEEFFKWFEKEKFKHNSSKSLLTEVMQWVASVSNINYNNIYIENLDK